jgi:hypothetical protein
MPVNRGDRRLDILGKYLMNELLGRVLDAHGGLERWNEYKKVDATIVSGGGFFPLKGVPRTQARAT